MEAATDTNGRTGWGGGVSPPAHPLPAWLEGGAEAAAQALLGWRLESSVGGEVTGGRIVETEAYPGPHDDASHAAARVGHTRRNSAMFGPAGRAYVYRIYGIHWCVNVVTDLPGHPSAVLIRALEPLRGQDVMRERRGRRQPLTTGPGRLCQALGIRGEWDGHPLHLPPLRLLPPEPGTEVDPSRVLCSPRIGISRAREAPLRFFLDGNPWVSPPRRGEPVGDALP